MNAGDALARLGAAARGARVTGLLHRAAIKCSYRVEQGGERFVLRVDETLARDLQLDRRAEARILDAAFRGGVGPELVAADFRAPAVLLLRYLPGRAWTPADLRDRHRLAQLADLLRRVHAIRVPGPALDLAAAARRYAERAGGGEALKLAEEVGELVAVVGPDRGSDGSRDQYSRLTPLLHSKKKKPRRSGVSQSSLSDECRRQPVLRRRAKRPAARTAGASSQAAAGTGTAVAVK